MTYVELYKKYRPKKWAQLIGQEKVARSLQGAVAANKLPTGFLFAGPRGCGKTSAAFLLAKALNCLNVDDKSNPCNECEVCLAIDDNSQIGVNYLSAANNGSVDDIRRIVQQARLNQPVKRQVWIIDEIHSISKSAFDSLLIPLEEKGMPALFIFCTTEIDRIPQTILSRISQRRFTLVDSDNLYKFLKSINDTEKLELSEDALNDAVRQGRGSVRDAMTALETIATTGTFSLSYNGQLLESISNHDVVEALKIMSQAEGDGQESRYIIEQLFEDLRNLLLYASNVDSSLVGTIPVSNQKEVAKGFIGRNGIMMVMNEVGEAINKTTFGSDARIHTEIALLKSIGNLKKLDRKVNSGNK